MPSEASNAMTRPSSQCQIPWLVEIPPEILLMILSGLTNRDRKSLRLTCKLLGEITPLSFSRVFLSADPLNIEGFALSQTILSFGGKSLKSSGMMPASRQGQPYHKMASTANVDGPRSGSTIWRSIPTNIALGGSRQRARITSS